MEQHTGVMPARLSERCKKCPDARALRWNVFREPWLVPQIEHGVELCLALLIAPIEIDRTNRAARRNALAVIAAAGQIDLVAPINRLFGAYSNTGIAARAEIEIDRIILRPLRLEGAQPAGQTGQRPRIDRKFALGR